MSPYMNDYDNAEMPSSLDDSEVLDSVLRCRVAVGSLDVVGTEKVEVEFVQNEFNFDHVSEFADVVEACQQAHQDLMALDVFRTIKIALEKGESPGQVDVFVSVVEKGRLQISTGTEVDSSESSLKLEGCVRSLFGNAESLRVGGRYGAKSSGSFEATLHKPRIYGTRGSVAFDAFISETNNVLYSSHTLKSRGVALRLLDPSGSLSLSYEGCWRDVVLPANKNPSKSITRDSRPSVKSSIVLQYIHDTRDIPMNATSGIFAQMRNELALPVGGDVTFAKSQVNTQLNIPLHQYCSLGFGFRGAAMMPFSIPGRVPSSTTFLPDRLQSGGPLDMRGFATRGLGPRDGVDMLGGELLMTARASLSVGLPSELLQRLHITAQAFVNAGHLVSLTDGTPLRTQAHNLVQDMRASAGIGVVVPSPIGRLEFNYCHPLRVFKNDRVANFQFGISGEFL